MISRVVRVIAIIVAGRPDAVEGRALYNAPRIRYTGRFPVHEVPMRIGLVTCNVLPEPDPDAAPLERALADRGHDSRWVAWDDTACDLSGFDLFVMRSAWNYYEDAEGFVTWCRRAHERARLINPPEVIAWNVHKGYLLTLQRAGVPIVPTTLVARGNAVGVPPVDAVVVKPAVSAGSVGARSFEGDNRDAALDYATSQARVQDVIIQPFIRGFANPGERALIYIAGEWTHAVRKHPRFAGQDERVDGGEPPAPDELAVARAAIDAVPLPVCYARVDLVVHEGQPVVSEVELIEPSLFFDHGVGAIERFVGMVEEQMA